MTVQCILCTAALTTKQEQQRKSTLYTTSHAILIQTAEGKWEFMSGMISNGDLSVYFPWELSLEYGWKMKRYKCIWVLKKSWLKNCFNEKKKITEIFKTKYKKYVFD